MREFSLKPKIEALDINVEGVGRVHVRQLTAGDKVRLAEMMGSMAEMAAKIRSAMPEANDAESIGDKAASMLSADQFRAFSNYQAEIVFLRWCDEDGKRIYTDRTDFDEVPAELVDAIYSQASKTETNEAEAEGNS